MEAVSLEVYGSVEVGGPLSNSESLLEKEEGRCITYGNCSSCNKQALKFQGLNTFKAKSYLVTEHILFLSNREKFFASLEKLKIGNILSSTSL